MTVDEIRHESRAFEADVAKLLNLIVHSVYSEKDVFIRELISNAADACEKLRYEAIANPALLGNDPVLLLSDPVDSFWVTSANFEGKPFKSVTQGAADLVLIPVLDDKNKLRTLREITESQSVVVRRNDSGLGIPARGEQA